MMLTLGNNRIFNGFITCNHCYNYVISSGQHMFRKAQEEPSNNALHTAILTRDNKAALEIIPTISAEELNHQSLGNTPLMLALKTANFEIARAILKRNDVVVVPQTFGDRASDSRGITPLHLACAWRENDIIHSILDKYQKFIAKDYGESFDIKDVFAASQADAALYYQVRLHFMMDKLTGINPFMKKRIEARTIAKIYSEDYERKFIHEDIKVHEDYQSIVDSPGLIINPAPELTDALFFHSQSICLNLGLIAEGDFKKFPASQHQFAHDLKKGLSAILEYRNKKPLDEKIIAIFGVDLTPAATPAKPKL